jgi:hypothetical protein
MELVAIDPDATGVTKAIVLYRYISVENLKYFFEGSFSLTRVSSWYDRMETADFEFLQEVQKFDPRGSFNDIFASCWTLDSVPPGSLEPRFSTTLADDELKKDGSASMWEDYCKTGGVRVATTLEKLLKNFQSTSSLETNLFYGKVKYLAARDSARFNNIERIEHALFHKRVGFRHEVEFRFICSAPNREQNYIQIPISDYFEFLDEILVFPLKDNSLCSIASELHDKGVNIATAPNKGINNKGGRRFCRISQLYGSVDESIGNVAFCK